MSSYIWVLHLIVAILLSWHAFAFATTTPRFTIVTPPAGRAVRIVLATALAATGFLHLLAIRVPFLAFFAATLAALTLALAGLLSAKRQRLPTGILLGMSGVLCIAIAAIQPLGLRVLMLPKADELPYVPAKSKVLKTYPEGVWFEGVAADATGVLYLTANHALDFSRTDYYRNAHGVLIQRGLNGDERQIFATGVGSTLGMVAVAPSGDLYVTSHGDTSGIWHVGRDAKASLLVQLPSGSWPNGITRGPDGLLYVADSNLGTIWRIDPKLPRADRAIVDSRLKARRIVALAPGANGIGFRGDDLIVTVSDTTQVLAFRRHADGSFGAPRMLASGIPGDDFAITANGNVFVTTHPYNTVVRLAPNGRRTIVGDVRQGIVGATAAALGRTEKDRNTLYVVTDGGAFTGGPTTRGQLVALSVQ